MDMSIAIPSTGCDRALHRVGDLVTSLACLVLEEVNCVRGVVPEQVVGPAPGVTERVGVGATEEVRLDVQLLNRRAHPRRCGGGSTDGAG